MKRIHPRSFGFAFALFLATWHAAWAFLVWAGGAQWLLDFVFRLHMITPPYQVGPFSLFTAMGLVLTTAAIGFVSGWFIGFVWNHFALPPTADWQLEQHQPRHA